MSASNYTTEVAEALNTLAELDKLLTTRSSGDIQERVKYRNMCTLIRRVLQKGLIDVTAEAIKASVEEVAPTPEPAAPVANARFVRANAKETTADLRSASVSHAAMLELLAKHIPNTDKAIVSVNTVMTPGQQMKKAFDNSVQTLVLVFSTNSDAYVVSEDKTGNVSVSPHKYWVQEKA